MRTLAIRLEPEMHQRLTFLAQLQGLSVTDVLRQAVERFVEEGSSNPELAAKAQEAMEALDRETAERKRALQALIGEGSRKSRKG